jgi:hypothetical protein
VNEVEAGELERAFRAGEPLDCGSDNGRRRVDAEALRRFCVERHAEVDPRGIALRGAVVYGTLDLAGVDVPFPLRFFDCEFEAAPILHGARLAELALVECGRLPGLLANGLLVDRDLDLTRSRVTGGHWTSASASKRAAIWLCESSIGGRLLCGGTTIRPDGERAVHADRMRVGGTVRLLRDFEAYGEVRLVGAHIQGSLDMAGVHIESDTEWALNLGDAVIAGGLFLRSDSHGRRPSLHGRISLRNARVEGKVLLRDTEMVRRDGGDDGGIVLAAARLYAGAGVGLEGTTRLAGTVDLSASDLSSLSIGATCALVAPGHTALDLTNAELREGLTLASGGLVLGTLRLVGTRVHGSLHLGGVTLSEPDGRSLVKADGLTVDGNVDLSNLSATGGALKFWRTTIGGGLDATGAELVNPTDCTLRIHQASVGGSVRLVEGFTSHGCVLLNRSTIEGRLDCTDATFLCTQPSRLNPEGHAIQAISATVRGGMSLGWRSVAPSVDFTDADTTVLADDPARWPKRYFIAGFRYGRFDGPPGRVGAATWNWRVRRAWLARQGLYDAGPYEQAARVFRQHGYAYGAEQILMAQRTQARRATRGRGPSRWLDVAYGWSVGYGYRPGRVLWLLVVLLALVSASLMLPEARATLRASDETGEVYTTTGVVRSGPDANPAPVPQGCGNGRIRCFHPIMYAIDTVMPLVSLEQRSTWYPSPHTPWGPVMEWWLNLATVAGWVLSSIFLLSIARMARTIA